MATFTVSIPDDLKKKLDSHPDINWSEYLKQKLLIRAEQFKKAKFMIDNGEI